MKLFKGKKKDRGLGAKMGVQGQPVNVFNSPTGTRRKGTAARNVTRIRTLELAMEKMIQRGKKDTPEYESLKAEHTRRTLHFEQDRLADSKEG